MFRTVLAKPSAGMNIAIYIAGQYLKVLALAILIGALGQQLHPDVQLPLIAGSFLLLAMFQFWSDLHDFEPGTLACYQAFARWTGRDPRQLDVLIEEKILPLCQSLNRFADARTLYSCQGHLRCYFQGIIPRMAWKPPYVMFHMQSGDRVEALSHFLFDASFKNYWDIKGSFRPHIDSDIDPGGDFVWTIQSRTVNGPFWQKRAYLDADIAMIVKWLHQTG